MSIAALTFAAATIPTKAEAFGWGDCGCQVAPPPCCQVYVPPPPCCAPPPCCVYGGGGGVGYGGGGYGGGGYGGGGYGGEFPADGGQSKPQRKGRTGPSGSTAGFSESRAAEYKKCFVDNIPPDRGNDYLNVREVNAET